jgi:hypothetical protein
MVNGKWTSVRGYYFYIILALTFFCIKVSYLSRALQNLTIFVTPMKRVDFSEVTGVRALSFRSLSVGENAAQSLSRGMRRGKNSPADKLLKRPAREPWN